KLIEEMRLKRESGQAPLVNIVFGMQNAPREEMKLTGLQISPLTTKQEVSRFDLSLLITEADEALRALYIYNTDLFDEATIIRIQTHFETLLAGIVARREAPLDELEMLSKAERSQRTASRAVREKYHSNRFDSVKPKAVAILDE